jgi:hypothetical protein
MTTTDTRNTWLDRLPHAPILLLIAIVTTVAVILGDFIITFANLTRINTAQWDKLHDFLPYLYLWAGGTYVGKRITAWKPGVDTPIVETPANGAMSTGPTVTTLTTASEAGKGPSAGQPPMSLQQEMPAPRAGIMARPSHGG